ncbi:glycosyltransferase [Carnobacterium divergens]|uniref:Glycosyl transferase family 1 n=1 Tax=Carnobacterium divergens TaxID=2748 RepID=A0A2R7ZYX0_CARDV|nr:glycosyltransferase [Carnobacterium divergens]MCO6018217.1 glycosyltransferase [Carnobacterium divergens]TFI64650.1 glycosyl transferase family 1 [Carnobacterium divergens]TFI75030.1 glycosyl transferase family 1 [Carnobacterium divergens]TFI79393.1 glycosyl transferase family 1 [Carnobacterium divergens]TFI85725.1 glycosyl transferase family 1 [Carnobacterium divergens]
MSNCLILLTNYYPYYKGEEYIESEIEYLSSCYDKVIIISTMVSLKMEQTREVPPNVEIIKSNINHSKMGKLSMFFKNYINIRKDKEKVKNIKKETETIFERLYSYYFEARALSIYKNIESNLASFEIDKFNVVTIYSYWFYITARVAIELKNKLFNQLQPYTISRAHRYDLYENESPLKFLPQRLFLLNELDNIYPCSQDGVDYLKNSYPMHTKKISVERLGTIDPFIQMIESKDVLSIVTCSAVRKVKRLDLLIEALKILEFQDIPFKWTHIGNGPELDELKKSAQKNLTCSNYSFVGFLKNNEVLNWYKNNPVTIFMNLSLSEGVPVSIMEAMSIGIPIVATDVGGTKEIVENNVNGLLLQKNCTPLEIANSIRQFYTMDLKKYNKFKINSKLIWENKSNADKLYLNFSKKILENS